jgi:hypothetical protein
VSPTSVIGLVPRSVRLDLEPCQLSGLRDELLTSIEARSGSIREEHDVRGAVDRDALHEASGLMWEHSKLLEAVSSDRGQIGETPVSIITPTAVADELVRGCAHHAAAQLVELVGEHSSDRAQLLRAATAAAAWTKTLVDLRYLDEEGPDFAGL